MDINNIASIYTIAAFYIAWLAFYVERRNRLQQRKGEKIDTLKSISNELYLMSGWFGASYTDLSYPLLQDPWHPFHMVYGLFKNDAIKNAISLKSISLFSEDFIKVLVFLNQTLGSFEQHVDRLVQFNNSNPVIATKAFYYYDRNKVFAGKDRAKKWIEFEKLAKKLSNGQNLNPEKIHLIGSVRILKDLHIFGIGSESQPLSLISNYKAANEILKRELENVDREKQFKQHPIFDFLDTIVFGSLLLSLYIFLMKGGVIMLNTSALFIGLILIVSIALGWIKFSTLVTEDWKWQRKFAEMWNDSINFFLAGLVGYYFILVRLPLLLKGEILVVSDFVLFIIFILGLFGHLCVLSKNITDGVEAIIKRVLEVK